MGIGCAQVQPSFLREKVVQADPGEITPEDFEGPLGGHFNKDGRWVPDDKTIEWTYKIPDISAGFIFDAHTVELTPSIQIEILEFHIPQLPRFNTWKFDFGVAHQRAYFYLGPRITSIFETSIGVFGGWNFKEKNVTFGVGFSIIRF